MSIIQGNQDWNICKNAGEILQELIGNVPFLNCFKIPKTLP